MSKEKLLEIRNSIDEVDQELLDLLTKRAELALFLVVQAQGGH